MTQTAIRVQEIAFTGYPVTDMPRARRFYEDILHLTPSEVADSGNWVEYEVQGAAFAICKYDGWEPSRHGPSIGFEVDDLDQAIATLKQHQVTVVMDPFETPVCWMAIVLDPEGNSVIIHKRKPV